MRLWEPRLKPNKDKITCDDCGKEMLIYSSLFDNMEPTEGEGQRKKIAARGFLRRDHHDKRGLLHGMLRKDGRRHEDTRSLLLRKMSMRQYVKARS